MQTLEQHSNNVPILNLPEPENYHRVLIVNARVCQAPKGRKRKTSANNDGAQTVKLLQYTIRFVEEPHQNCLLSSGVRFSNYRDSRYGKLLQAAGVDLDTDLTRITRSLVGKTLLIRVRHVTHPTVGVALRIIETQPDYPSA